MKRRITTLIFGLLPLASVRLPAACCPSISNADHLSEAAVVCRGRVMSRDSFYRPDGIIWTRAQVRLVERIKGDAADEIQVLVPGGVVGDTGMSLGNMPQMQTGEERLLLLHRNGDGTFGLLHGAASAIRLMRQTLASGRRGLPPGQGALLAEFRRLAGKPEEPVPDEAGSGGEGVLIGYLNATNVLGDVNGVSPRFVLPDQGEPIPYLVDATYLPAGISLNNALIAVSNAVTAWANVTSLKFRFEGLQSFGAAADTINADDGRLRIQLHDAYNSITNGSTLGIGGPWYSTASPNAGGWGKGGQVAGIEFHRTKCGFVVLEHTNATLSSLSTLTEVLCHEVGHAIGMAHSSENPSEPHGTAAYQAIMYYQAHNDGRGASLNALDRMVVSQINPSNTPPFTFSRILDVVTHPAGAPNVAGINQVQLRGYDMQTTNLTLQGTNYSGNNGSYNMVGNMLSYTPAGYFGDQTRFDPTGNSYYDIAYFRFVDGTNASALGTVRVLSYYGDTKPAAASDGLPDSWMITYFGNADPNTGLKHKAGDDFDGDGLSNLQEFIAGSNPTIAGSAQKITSFGPGGLQWQAKPYELYEVLGSTNLTQWARAGNPVVPTTTNGLAPGLLGNMPRQFFRIQKVP